MGQFQPLCVQRLSWETGDQPSGILCDLFWLAPINRIAGEWMANGMHVHADLMCASRLEAALEQRASIKFFQHPIVSTCLFAASGYGHFCAMHRMSSHRCINPSVNQDIAQYERQIIALHGMFL